MPYKDKEKRRESNRRAWAAHRARAIPLTLDMLREVATYNPETGEFVRIKGALKKFVGAVMGKLDTHGHRQIRLFGRDYAAHRLAWLWVYGEWPQGIIDHINGKPDDNRIANLRVATFSQNQANTRMRVDNSSGRRGVFRTPYNSWQAYIHVRRKRINLGTFSTMEEASQARLAAEIEHFGEFRRAG